MSSLDLERLFAEPLAVAESRRDGERVRRASARQAVALIPRAKLCCWPVGEPGERGFKYCEAPLDGERVYCRIHAAAAYVTATARARR